jgi:sugar lactone lactonase YvrE
MRLAIFARPHVLAASFVSRSSFLAILGGLLAAAQPAAAQPVTFLDSFGSAGSGPGQFSLPIGVAVSDTELVYVVDLVNNRVQRFDEAGGNQLSFGLLGSGPGQLDFPDSVAVSDTGLVYVTDRGDDLVQRFDAGGNHQLSFATFGLAPGQSDVRGVAVNSSGQVYVAERGVDQVQRFDADGMHQLSFGTSGTGPGEFDEPRGVAVNSSGQVYVVDNGNNRVQRFNVDGVHQLSFGSSGSGAGQFNFPTGIAVSDTDRVYVADTNNNRVQRFDALGNHLLSFGSFGSGPGQLSSPAGVAVSDTGLVYVADTNNNRVQRWFAPSEWTQAHTHTFAAVTLGESLSLSAGKNLHVTGTTTVNSTGALILAGGQFTTGALNIQAGGSVTVQSGPTLVTSSLTHAGHLELGGTLAVGSGLNLDGNATLFGHGAVVGRVNSMSMGVGVTVAEGQTLTLGDANHADGVAIDGTIIVGAMGGPASALILLDANRATIGITRLHAGALLDAPHGITLLTGRALNALGSALVDGDFTNSGTVNGPTGAGQVLSFNDNVNGAGNYTGNIAFLQGFSPGASPAAVALENLRFNPLSTLTIELGGTTAGSEFDQLLIAGDIALDSASLDIQTLDNFVPSAGQSFEILDIAGTRSGMFAGLEEGARAASFGGTDLLITYRGGDGNDVVLLTQPILPGDFNHDGSVDAADYVAWRAGLGAKYSQTDYGVWRANFGRVAAAAASGSNFNSHAAVPETSTIALLLLAALTFVCTRARGENGALAVSLIDGFTLTADQSFTILDVRGVLSGNFAGLIEGALVGKFGATDLLITYTGGDGNDVALFTQVAALAGDFNRDGSVDAADYVVWRAGLGSQYSQNDHDVWRANFGRVAGASATSSSFNSRGTVPEASTVMLFLTGTLFLTGAIGMFGRRTKRVRARVAAPAIALFTFLIAGAAAQADLVVTFESDGASDSAIRLTPGDVLLSTGSSEFDSPLTNNGTVQGPTAPAEFLTFTDQVHGAGNYEGNIAFDGHFSPGNSPAVVTFEGNLSFGPSNVLTVELGGTALGEFDRLEVSGNMSLAGSRVVELISPFMPTPGQMFEIIDVGGMLSGQFAGLNEGGLVATFGTVHLTITYAGGDGNDVTLQASAIPEPTWVASVGIVLAAVCGWLISIKARPLV